MPTRTFRSDLSEKSVQISPEIESVKIREEIREIILLVLGVYFFFFHKDFENELKKKNVDV